MTTTKCVTTGKDSEMLKSFFVKKFAELGETYTSFSKNSDYKRQAVDMVINGTVASPRIRRDIARYLGRESWEELMEDYRKEREAGNE